MSVPERSAIGMQLFCNVVQEERAFSEEQSALVSTAYATLRQPLKRAIYLVREISSGRGRHAFMHWPWTWALPLLRFNTAGANVVYRLSRT